MGSGLADAGQEIDHRETCTGNNTVHLECGSDPFTGVLKTTRYDGVTSLQNYVNGVREGTYRSWYADGAERCQGNYSMGLPDGPSQCFYPNGRVRTEKRFMLGKQIGKSLYWYDTGALKKQFHYLDGLEHGIGTEWFNSGTRKSEGTFVHGELSGRVTYWYESGALRREIDFFDGKIKDGEYRSWHEDGSIRSTIGYESGLRNGKAQWWDQHGIESEGFYKNDKPIRGYLAEWDLHGNRVYEYLNNSDKVVHRYWDNDRKLSRSVELQNGEKHGLEIEYFENGSTKSRLSFEEGKLEGPSSLWYKNGQERVEYIFSKNTLVDGQYQIFCPDGRSRAIVSYRSGVKEGLLVWWDSTGDEHRSYYSNGGLVEGLPPPFDYEWHYDLTVVDPI